REEGGKISRFVSRMERLKKLPFRTAVENDLLPEYFKHYALPFYVLLNEDGMVQGMFGLKEMEESLIARLVRNKQEVFDNELTNDTRSFPSLLASRYSENASYYYTFFHPGNNKVF